MNPFSRWITLVATLTLLLAYFTPIWKIHLWAPQYPEGLEMQIWISKLTGDIAIINGLNHYIGMANIDEAMFPELKFLSYLLGAIILLGILTVISNRRGMLYAFTIVLVFFSLAALVDMYIWGYKYGHNLDPHAAIKIDGESYQPPLIGYKQLLNFTALSMPDKGGWALFGAVALSLFASLINWFNIRIHKKATLSMGAAALLLVILLNSCQPSIEPLIYGQDACVYCEMKLVDNKFGAEIITAKGKVYKFDDLNCMLNYKAEQLGTDETSQLLVIDFSSTGNLIDVNKAHFLKSDYLRSPMGFNTAAFEKTDSLDRYLSIVQGEKLSWNEISKIQK